MGELSQNARGSFEGGRLLQGGPTALTHARSSVSQPHHRGRSVPRKPGLLPVHKTTWNITWNPRRPHGKAPGRCSQECLEARGKCRLGAEPVLSTGIKASASRGRWAAWRGGPRRHLSHELTWQARWSRPFRPTGALAASTGGQSLQALWEGRTIWMDSQQQRERGRGTAQSPVKAPSHPQA